MNRRPLTSRLAFTLVEMLVVVGVVIILLAISIPAFNVWESKKREDAINLVNGLLYRAQLAATIDNKRGKNFGLFFYIDPETNRQRIWSIEQDFDPRDPALPNEFLESRYVLRDVDPVELPGSMRVVPLSVVVPDPLLPQFQWTVEQLDDQTHDDVATVDLWTPTPDPLPANVTALDPLVDDPLLPTAGNFGTQYHRNFFTVVFDEDGQLLVNHRAFIIDEDPENIAYNPSGFPNAGYAGFHTGLPVNDSASMSTSVSAVPTYYRNALIDNGSPVRPLFFRTETGVLVYDEEVFQTRAGAPSSDRVDYLNREAQPLYIQPIAGRIIKGVVQGT